MLGGAIGWLLEPVPDFAIALGMAAAWGVAGLAPPSLVFGGFATSAWVTALAALGHTSAMAASGLLFRVALMLLRVFPPTHRGQVVALLAGGVVLTPWVPVFGRVATVAPVARASQALGYTKQSREARSPLPRSSATPSSARSDRRRHQLLIVALMPAGNRRVSAGSGGWSLPLRGTRSAGRVGDRGPGSAPAIGVACEQHRSSQSGTVARPPVA
jgi:di/tricarboxylate transporter